MFALFECRKMLTRREYFNGRCSVMKYKSLRYESRLILSHILQRLNVFGIHQIIDMHVIGTAQNENFHTRNSSLAIRRMIYRVSWMINSGPFCESTRKTSLYQLDLLRQTKLSVVSIFINFNGALIGAIIHFSVSDMMSDVIWVD